MDILKEINSKLGITIVFITYQLEVDFKELLILVKTFIDLIKIYKMRTFSYYKFKLGSSIKYFYSRDNDGMIRRRLEIIFKVLL